MLARAVSQDAVVSPSEAEDTRTVKDALAELDKRLAHETSSAFSWFESYQAASASL
jgi:hypothetical protein